MMSLGEQIFVVTSFYLLFFWFIRWILWGVKHYQLNTSAYKKRKKGETFKEWFLYSRYQEEIPKILLVLYFTIVLIHPLAIILCVIFYFIEALNGVGDFLARIIYVFDPLWLLIYSLLFWSPGRDIPYERWIKKKRGNKKKK